MVHAIVLLTSAAVGVLVRTRPDRRVEYALFTSDSIRYQAFFFR